MKQIIGFRGCTPGPHSQPDMVEILGLESRVYMLKKRKLVGTEPERDVKETEPAHAPIFGAPYARG